MAPTIPYTYIQCPCSNDAPTLAGKGDDALAPRTSSPQDGENDAGNGDDDQDDDGDDDKTFDPRAPRSNFSLYPLEHLLYCEDCHQIRCPRCVAEEMVTYYCPNCLFDVPSTYLKTDGNKCTRSCFQCPVCTGPMGITSAAPSDAAATASMPTGPFVLTCTYCAWSSSEVGIQFDKANSMHLQLAKLRNGGGVRVTAKERHEERRREARSHVDEEEAGGDDGHMDDYENKRNKTKRRDVDAADLDMETQFANLKAFYQTQLADGGAVAGLSMLGLGGDYGYGSPTQLSRIMSMYTTPSRTRTNTTNTRAPVMREALHGGEGLRPADLDESASVAALARGGLACTATAEQQRRQVAAGPNAGEPAMHGRARFADTLRPLAHVLRTKRSKRCPACRHIISKPEGKLGTRFKIRLVAGSFLPRVSVRPLPMTTMAGDASDAALPPSPSQTEPLRPLQPVQYLLTFRNPIFAAVRVTLATPAMTPGRFSSKVTLLCPQFSIDANSEVWDDALKNDSSQRGSVAWPAPGVDATTGSRVEAGKIWQRGRNWVSVAVEMVPASLRLDLLKAMHPDDDVDTSPLREDEHVLEIPIFVRLEWEAEAGGDVLAKDKEAKEKRELAYWCVVGIGRIAQE